MRGQKIWARLTLCLAGAASAVALLAVGVARADDTAIATAPTADRAPIAVAAQDAAQGGVDTAAPGQDGAEAPDKAAVAAANAHGLLAVPIPLIDPQLGDGVIPAGGFFYKPVEGGRPWVTGAAGILTSKHDWGLGFGQQADLLDGRLRVMAAAGYGRFFLDFFGTGVAAGATGRSIKLNQSGFGYFFNALYGVEKGGPVFIGLRSLGVRLDTSVATQIPPPGFPSPPPTIGLPPLPPLFASLPGLPTPPISVLQRPLVLKTNDIMIGPAFELDTRDSEFMPTKGTYAEGHLLFAEKALGSTFQYNKFFLALNEYIPLDKNTVLALRAMLCHSSNGAPFYDLCLYGTQHDLRGYEGGRYRDHSQGAMQAEVRRHLFWRLGAVAFAGIGGVAPDFNGLFSTKPLPSAGVGLRFQPVAKIPVNMSVDYAWGVDSQAIYLYLRDAF